MKFRTVSVLLILLLLVPSTVFARESTEPSTAPVTLKFSHGGLRLDITNNLRYASLILNLTITFCDGTSVTGRQIGMFRKYLSKSFTYTADQPIRSVVVNAVNPGQGENGRIVVVSLARSCTASSSVSPLYCKNVSLAPVIHRSTSEPISFKGPAFVYSAGLRIPGVDGLVMTRKIHRTSGYSWPHTVNYNYRSRTWNGVIPTLYIPAGIYHNVWLVVQDGYGKQAKCRVGDLTVKP